MPKPHRAVVYVRLSVSLEQSVSIERQIRAAEEYAAQRKWTIVGVFRDDGVSATKNKPEDRKGWRALMASNEPYDTVIVWKLDRLVRNLVHFWDTYRWLDNNDASLVSVMDNLDMNTPMGRIIASILAGFAEMEAKAISERVAGARTHLLSSGRVVGGTVPYGWRSIENPDGKGYVLRRDPDKIDWVRGMVERAQAGESIYAITKWLDTDGAPLPTKSQQNRKRDGWHYSTVERILRHPILAGATAFNPGNDGRTRGTELLRDKRGLPVVDEAVAIMPLQEWRALVRKLDERDSPQAKSRPLRDTTSTLLSGMVWCGDGGRHEEPVRMWRGTIQGRPAYYCPSCHMSISNFEDAVIEEFLRQKGDQMRWSRIQEVYEGGAAELPEVEQRITELQSQQNLTDDDDEYDRIAEQIKGLRKLRRELRSQPDQIVDVWNEDAEGIFSEVWARAESVEEQRAVLDDAIARIVVRRGRPGRRKAGAVLDRLEFVWVRPHEIGPREAHTA